MIVIKRLLILFLITISCWLVYLTGSILSDKSEYRCLSFYKTNEKYDVLLLGPSTVLSGLAPMDLWNEYGIVSYNIAANGQPLANNYWMLRNAVRKNKPKVVVVETGMIFFDLKWTHKTRQARFHEAFDNIPFTIDKYKAVFDLVPIRYWADYLMPRAVYYHSRWEKIATFDFLDSNDIGYYAVINRGGLIANISKKNGKRFDISILENPFEVLPKTDIKKCNKENADYIKKIIDYCKEEDIKVLFINFPEYAYDGETGHGNGYNLQRMWNYADQIVSSKGVEYINCLREIEDIGFIYSEDLRDYYHLNVSGNRKITHYIGKHLQSRYGVPDRRGESLAERWNADYVKFNEYREKVAQEE